MIGTTLGKIEIKRSLGKGGMGDVYVGFDATLQREVAVKVISGVHRQSTEARVRFIREARILSKLEHPNICRIYDYIEGEDEDFIIMELIQGRVLDADWIQNTSFVTKLQVARQIAQVLDAAHAKNVVHRDLKPENVMITEQGTVKVLDFGIAHPTIEADMDPAPQVETEESAHQVSPSHSGDIKLLSDTFKTQVGETLGTPMFMSPEQARGETTEPSSDMYSLGLLMQWLFMGEYPYPGEWSLLLLIANARQGKSLPVQGLDPDLTDLINRLKSVSPSQRPNAATVLEKLQWIAEKPKRKLRKRVTIAFVILLVLAVTISTAGFVQAKRSEKQARAMARAAVDSRDETASVVAFLEDMLTSAKPDAAGIHVKMVDVLDQAAEKLSEDYDDRSQIRARIHYTLANTYVSLGMYAKAEAQCRQALDIRTAVLGLKNAETLSSMTNLANILSLEGRYDEVAKLLPKALELSRELRGDDDIRTLTLMNNLGVFYMNQMKYEKAQSIYAELVERKTRVLSEQHPSTLGSICNLALCLMQLDRVSDAEQWFRKALHTAQDALGENHPHTLLVKSNLAWTLEAAGKLEQAERLHQEVLSQREKILGPTHPHTLWSMNKLASVKYARGDSNGAQELFEKVLNLRTQALGAYHPDCLETRALLAQVCLDLNEPQKVAQLLDQILAHRDKAKPHDEALAAMHALAKKLEPDTPKAAEFQAWCNQR